MNRRTRAGDAKQRQRRAPKPNARRTASKCARQHVDDKDDGAGEDAMATDEAEDAGDDDSKDEDDAGRDDDEAGAGEDEEDAAGGDGDGE